MNLKKAGAEFFIPDGKAFEEAAKRTTHLAIVAHQDDIEIMAYDGILKCFGREDMWFSGAVVTNGAGSPRDGLYSSYTDLEMQKVRKLEQKKAAFVGEYGILALMNYSSSEVKDPNNAGLVKELAELITDTKPQVIYTHNPADKHDTHVGVAMRIIAAIRSLPPEYRPEKLFGCEVWRNLDWVNDEEKVAFDVSAHPNLAGALVEVFDSQICGGKRYDLATQGRRLANATYAASHGVDVTSSLIYGIDLTELITGKGCEINISEYIRGFISRFEKDVTDRIEKLC